MLKTPKLIDHKRQQNEVDFHNSMNGQPFFISLNKHILKLIFDQFKKGQYVNFAHVCISICLNLVVMSLI